MRATILVVVFIYLLIGYVTLADDDGICKDQQYYIDEDNDRLVVARYDVNNKLKGCLDYGELSFFDRLFISMPDKCTTKVNDDGLEKILKKCPRVEPANQSHLSLLVDQNPLLSLYDSIYPGTRWCGAGNISDELQDTGSLKELDRCCRTHDHCPDFIGVKETKHGITNDGHGSYVLCECDEKFFNCLHGANDVYADHVGFLFFDFLATPCFKKEHPITKCLKKKEAVFKDLCEQYELDTSKEPVYQLFDNKYFYTKSMKEETSE